MHSVIPTCEPYLFVISLNVVCEIIVRRISSVNCGNELYLTNNGRMFWKAFCARWPSLKSISNKSGQCSSQRNVMTTRSHWKASKKSVDKHSNRQTLISSQIVRSLNREWHQWTTIYWSISWIIYSTLFNKWKNISNRRKFSRSRTMRVSREKRTQRILLSS